MEGVILLAVVLCLGLWLNSRWRDTTKIINSAFDAHAVLVLHQFRGFLETFYLDHQEPTFDQIKDIVSIYLSDSPGVKVGSHNWSKSVSENLNDSGGLWWDGHQFRLNCTCISVFGHPYFDY